MQSHAREEKASRQSTNRRQTHNSSPYPKAENVAQACALVTY